MKFAILAYAKVAFTVEADDQTAALHIAETLDSRDAIIGGVNGDPSIAAELSVHKVLECKPQRTYTVVGLYDTGERYADTFEAQTPEEAEGMVPAGVDVAGVFAGELEALS